MESVSSINYSLSPFVFACLALPGSRDGSIDGMASTETVEPFGVPGSSAGGRDIQTFVEIGSQLEVAGSITASHARKALETTIDVLLQEL